MVVSIVVPARNEEGCLEPLYREIRRVFEEAGEDFELVVVNDGSTDATPDVIDRLAASDERVRGVHLARGFGHQPALLAGIQEARGDVVVTMDADLEQPPSAVLEMLARWRDGYQVVHGVRRDHPDTGLFKRVTSRWFYRVFTFLSRVPMEPGMLDFRLMDRQVVDSIGELTERDFFFRGIATWIGFRQTRLPYDAGKRAAGSTKYDVRKMVAFAL
ncbi:MAG: glycosyltransferase family 2 protein, partial [Deltaproteobacteria bacterium]|nr:glycosyltransferase family 2 protein [Deltaproteobacteria bacterium]